LSSAKEKVIETSTDLKKKVVDTSVNIKDKFDKMEVKDKIVSTGTSAYSSARGFGGKVLEKGKEIYVK